MKGFTIEKAQKYVAEHTTATMLDTEWVNSKKPMRFVCECGNVFVTDWNHFQQGRTICTECAKRKQYNEKRLTEDDIRARIARRSDSVWVAGEYKNENSVLTLRCACGNLFTADCEMILYGRSYLRCKACSSKLRSSDRKTEISFIAAYAEDHGAKLLSTEYVAAREPLLFRCSCGRTFKRSWNDFYSGQSYRCRYCAKRVSRGEWEVEKILSQEGVFYEREKKFPDCVDERPLPFDFYLPDYNMCIEFDGEQHYREVAFGGSKEHFEKVRAHDQIKTDYCTANGIKLVRIPYYNAEFADIVISSMLTPREA